MAEQGQNREGETDPVGHSKQGACGSPIENVKNAWESSIWRPLLCRIWLRIRRATGRPCVC